MDNISGTGDYSALMDNKVEKQEIKEIKKVELPTLELNIDKFKEYYQYKPSNELSTLILNLERSKKLLTKLNF